MSKARAFCEKKVRKGNTDHIYSPFPLQCIKCNMDKFLLMLFPFILIGKIPVELWGIVMWAFCFILVIVSFEIPIIFPRWELSRRDGILPPFVTASVVLQVLSLESWSWEHCCGLKGQFQEQLQPSHCMIWKITVILTPGILGHWECVLPSLGYELCSFHLLPCIVG